MTTLSFGNTRAGELMRELGYQRQKEKEIAVATVNDSSMGTSQKKQKPLRNQRKFKCHIKTLLE